MINLRSREEIEEIREGGKILFGAMQLIEESIVPGIKTADLDKLAAEYIYDNGGEPAFHGFQGYPGNICISIGSQVVHGIPGERELSIGEIVGIDIGVKRNRYYCDSAKTFEVGEVTEEHQKLVNVTKESLFLGIAQALQGKRLSEISRAIQTHAESNGFSIVRQLVGHGIGTSLHEEPKVPNFVDKEPGPVLQVGMVLAIEPMLNMESPDVYTDEDGWTILKKDGKPSAHFEHTVAILEDGPIVLTNGSTI